MGSGMVGETVVVVVGASSGELFIKKKVGSSANSRAPGLHESGDHALGKELKNRLSLAGQHSALWQAGESSRAIRGGAGGDGPRAQTAPTLTPISKTRQGKARQAAGSDCQRSLTTERGVNHQHYGGMPSNLVSVSTIPGREETRVGMSGTSTSFHEDGTGRPATARGAMLEKIPKDQGRTRDSRSHFYHSTATLETDSATCRHLHRRTFNVGEKMHRQFRKSMPLHKFYEIFNWRSNSYSSAPRCTYDSPDSKSSTLRSHDRGLGFGPFGIPEDCAFGGESQAQRASQKPSTGIQNKINQLEGLVVSLMASLNSKQSDEVETGGNAFLRKPEVAFTEDQVNVSGTESDVQSKLSDTFGRISLENAEMKYVDGAHWTAILDGIAELKDHFEDDVSETKEPVSEPAGFPTEEPELLFGLKNYATKQEILAAIPARPVVDRLISKYFNAMDMSPVVIHSPSFLKQYERFWESPSSTPIMWIGLLFSMMCLAVQFRQGSLDLPGITYQPFPISENRMTIEIYREKVVQCLVLGNYTKPTRFAMETLLLYFTIEHFRSPDSQIGSWILVGMIVRIAMRMGYHRDPSHFPRITPFQGEMRRRAWAMIVQIDLATSHQLGLPRIVRESQADTADPRNLIDGDFEENTVELPPSRPDSDLTPMLYVIVKNRILSVYTQIVDLASAKNLGPYSEVLRLDRLLHDVHARTPPNLQVRSTKISITDQPEVVMRRLYLEIIFQAARCNLHRRYLPLARPDTPYMFSKQSCLEAALQLLQIQYTMDEETQPGGVLFEDRWKVSSIVNHDYLLGTTILCVYLDHSLKDGPSLPLSEGSADREARQRVIIALQESYRIWLKSSNSSREAQKAAEALRIVLGKAKRSGLLQRGDSKEGVKTPEMGIGTDTGIRSSTTSTTSGANTGEKSRVYEMIQTPVLIENMQMEDQIDCFGWNDWDSQFQDQDLEGFFNVETIPDDFPLGESIGVSDWYQLSSYCEFCRVHRSIFLLKKPNETKRRNVGVFIGRGPASVNGFGKDDPVRAWSLGSCSSLEHMCSGPTKNLDTAAASKQTAMTMVKDRVFSGDRTPWVVAIIALVLIWSLYTLDIPSVRLSALSGHEETAQTQTQAGAENDATVVTIETASQVIEGGVSIPTSTGSSNPLPPTTSPKEGEETAATNSDRPLILYAYSDGKTDSARINLEFFIKHGLHGAADFIFILNGKTNATEIIPNESNIRVVQRENDCYDLGAYAEVLTTEDLYKKYKRFVMLNASIRGPFLPYWAKGCWSDMYLGRITDEVKLVGMTGNCWPAFHVQSMIWATDMIGIETLLFPSEATVAAFKAKGVPHINKSTRDGDEDKKTPPAPPQKPGINSCFHTWSSAVNAEVGASSLIEAAGYKLDVMMAAYHGMKDYEAKCPKDGNGDVLWNNKYYGTNVHPFETVFIKANRDVDPVGLEKHTEWMNGREYSSYEFCKAM
ncbi:hypothetical protein G7Y89_g13112 [Cudoniella acicularis]|uniref:Xylanolytic transcriptional activator regulatory domain-containing protein n=1 Tax=Cudoniella acicularis TaxID=354080 RepID=A0A8H4R8V4_9HELO|nr:hypothetical protein G7Y89_g13112 [Cudoniella acicularis]